MEKITIIVLNFNGSNDTLECLESLQDLSKSNISKIQILLVDNNSTDTVVEITRKKFPQVHIIENKKNEGFAGGNNRGIEYALANNATHIVFLNNDTVVDKNFIEELLRGFKNEKNVGITVPKVYFYKGREFHKKKYKENELGRVLWYAGGLIDWKNLIATHRGVDEIDIGQYDTISKTDFATGCCMMVSADIFRKIGLLDEDYFLYYEDSDFNERVKRSGYNIFFIPKAVIWHKNAGSSGGSGSELHDYFITRNRMIFGMKYASLRTKVALIRESFRLLLTGRVWQIKGIQDYFFHRWGRGSYPINE